VARVVAVADAFNAMIGRRPYRAPMPPSQALDQLVDGRGTQFDPDVVDAMIDVVTSRS
jgi:putative two-component system response regulator